MKFILVLILLPTISFANIDFDNFYKENKFELDSIAHCSGFIQGVFDIFVYLSNEHKKEVDNQFTEEEKDELANFLNELNYFNKTTKDELNFQLEMKCGKDRECRTEYANKAIEGFNEGFDIIYMLYESDEDGLNNYAEEYLNDSDVLLEMCFDKAK